MRAFLWENGSINEIHLLPALPDAWVKGSVRGLRARGGYTVDISWENGRFKFAGIKPDFNGEVKIRYHDRVEIYQTQKGKYFEILF